MENYLIGMALGSAAIAIYAVTYWAALVIIERRARRRNGRAS